MRSTRFDREVYITSHARQRMAQRGIGDLELAELLETGELRYKDDKRLWVAKAFASREDNLVRAAVALEARLVVKTVMHHFEWGCRDADKVR